MPKCSDCGRMWRGRSKVCPNCYLPENKPVYYPTQEEIRQGCQAIQARWNTHTRHKRSAHKTPEVIIPIVEIPKSGGNVVQES